MVAPSKEVEVVKNDANGDIFDDREVTPVGVTALRDDVEIKASVEDNMLTDNDRSKKFTK